MFFQLTRSNHPVNNQHLFKFEKSETPRMPTHLAAVARPRSAVSMACEVAVGMWGQRAAESPHACETTRTSENIANNGVWRRVAEPGEDWKFGC